MGTDLNVYIDGEINECERRIRRLQLQLEIDTGYVDTPDADSSDVEFYRCQVELQSIEKQYLGKRLEILKRWLLLSPDWCKKQLTWICATALVFSDDYRSVSREPRAAKGVAPLMSALGCGRRTCQGPPAQERRASNRQSTDRRRSPPRWRFHPRPSPRGDWLKHQRCGHIVRDNRQVTDVGDCLRPVASVSGRPKDVETD
jgi:hypothetical protein